MSGDYKKSVGWEIVTGVITRANEYINTLGDKQREKEMVLGNISYYKTKCDRLHAIVSESKPKLILEIGLNAGHSAAIMLDASPDAEFISFDIADRKYIRDASLAFVEKFPNFVFFAGDSAKTVPEFLSRTTGEIDLAFIDGAHTFESVLADVNNVVPRISKGGYVIVDDVEIKGIAAALKQTLAVNSDFDLIETIHSERFTKNRFSDVAVYRRKS